MEKKKLAIRYLVKNNIHAIAHLIGNRSVINRSINYFFLMLQAAKIFWKACGFYFLFLRLQHNISHCKRYKDVTSGPLSFSV